MNDIDALTARLMKMKKAELVDLLMALRIALTKAEVKAQSTLCSDSYNLGYTDAWDDSQGGMTCKRPFAWILSDAGLDGDERKPNRVVRKLPENYRNYRFYIPLYVPKDYLNKIGIQHD